MEAAGRRHQEAPGSTRSHLADTRSTKASPRNHQEAPRRHFQEAASRHPGGTQETPKKYLGGTQCARGLAEREK